MAKIKRTPKAKQDLLEHVLYLTKINLDIAERFIDASEETFVKLAQMPRKGKLREREHPELVGVRQWFVSGFDHYLIFYRPIKGGIEILRVLHGTQDIDAILDSEASEE
jgi:toxin ParE1/3/4